MPQGPIQQGPRPSYPGEPYSNGPPYPPPQNQYPARMHKQEGGGGEYRESPPPPPPPTSTHPLYQATQSGRYAASMADPPRGGYYPANNTPLRPYQLQGTNPWEREEKEKVSSTSHIHLTTHLHSVMTLESHLIDYFTTGTLQNIYRVCTSVLQINVYLKILTFQGQ